ncbi:MAG: glycogen synthase [Anaerolineales bacterium]|nr:glycogen synthase [Anaerolineales bacterium]
MNIFLLTNEYPPHVYGGAGVHIDNLSRALAVLDDSRHRIDVLAFGDQQVDSGNLHVRGVEVSGDLPAQDPRHGKLFQALQRNLRMAGLAEGPDVIHCHTWYTHFAGCLLQQLTGTPLVLTTHSLEPQRPWKEEQLGRAYQATTWLERTAYQQADGVIAVSAAMADDVSRLYEVPSKRVQVIHNGIDPEVYKPTQAPERLKEYGIDPTRPFLLFVGRISRQKGLSHLLRAVHELPEDTQVVLCAGAPDTEELAREVQDQVERLSSTHSVVWIQRMVAQQDLIAFYSHAQVFVCPSVYEPFGLINLEAMACGTPVVGSAVGGIPEVVEDGETGLLVALDSDGETAEPRDPAAFAHELAVKVNTLLKNPERAHRMGQAGRSRVLDHFTWNRVAEKTLRYYRTLADGK